MIRYIQKSILVFAGYFVAAKICASLDPFSGFATFVWAPSGVALASLLSFGSGLWPAIALAAFAVILGFGVSVPLAIGITAGVTLEAIIGSYLLAHVAKLHKTFDRMQDVIIFILFGVGIAPLISATIGFACLSLSSNGPMNGLIWWDWWAGDGLGVLIVAPLVLVLANHKKQNMSRFVRIEAFVLALCMIGLAGALYRGKLMIEGIPTRNFPYIFFPFMVWAALRFGQLGNVIVTFFISWMAILTATSGLSGNVNGPIREKIFLLLTFVSIFVVTGMLLSAAIMERKQVILRYRRNLEKLQFLDEIHQILTSSLYYHESIREFAVLVASKFGDSCVVELLDNQGQVSEMVAVGSPASAEVSLHPSEKAGVIASARAFIWPRGIIAPLVARGQVFGVITVSSLQRQYQGDDLDFMRDVALRAGMAIDNSILYEKAQEAIQIRDQFLSIASHELKTPITSLGLQIQATARKLDAENNVVPSASQLARVFDISRRQVKRLTNLVEELLDVSRIQTGKLQFSLGPLDLSQLLNDMVHRFSLELERAKCSAVVEIQDGVTIIGDGARLEQVVDNLMSNAIKYAPGKPVRVFMSATDHHVQFAIEDNGPGIPKNHQKRIFERYERLPNAEFASGLGLGLFIASEIVKGHRGTIRVDSDDGRGSRFIVDLPRSQP